MRTYQKKTLQKEVQTRISPLRVKVQKASLRAAAMSVLLIIGTLGTMDAHAATNLVGNPNLETEVAAPAIWNRGGYGENTASFSYPMNSALGSRAVRVDMTSRISGDAKWYFDDVPVKPSTTYIFSDTSMSDVPTSVDIRYKVINRTLERLGVADKYRYRYVKLGDVPIQSTPTAKQFAFTTPPNAVSLTIFHYIDRVGYLVTDNYSLTEEGDDGTPAPDTIAPTVSITSPASGTAISGTTTISVNALDNIGVTGVRLAHSGTNHADIPIGTEDTVAPYSFEWGTSGVANGVHLLRAEARDAAGNIATSTTISVTVSNAATTTDTTAPTISVTAPINGATVLGTTTVTMNAADDTGIAGVSLMLDGIVIGTEDTSTPYSFEWNTVGITNGTHTLSGKARDAAGNTTTSSSVLVTVNNSTTTTDTAAPTVSVTAPLDGITVSGTTTISVTATDNGSIVSNTLFIGGAPNVLGTSSPATFEWNTLPLANGVYTIYAVAMDGAGNTATSSAISVTVNNVSPDTTAPSVSITTPANGATISSTSTISVNATDEGSGVAGVSILLDGTSIGTEDTASPYSFEWNTTGSQNGIHTLSARARDAAGNIATSTTISVTVSN